MDAAGPGDFVLHNFIILDLNLIVVIKKKKKNKPGVCQFETTAKINKKKKSPKGKEFFLLVN